MVLALNYQNVTRYNKVHVMVQSHIFQVFLLSRFGMFLMKADSIDDLAEYLPDDVEE